MFKELRKYLRRIVCLHEEWDGPQTIRSRKLYTVNCAKCGAKAVVTGDQWQREWAEKHRKEVVVLK
jgi:hypothetical protein